MGEGDDNRSNSDENEIVEVVEINPNQNISDICSKCNQSRKVFRRQMCRACYDKSLEKEGECVRCHVQKQLGYKSKTVCCSCNSKERSDKKKQKPEDICVACKQRKGLF